MFCSSIYKRVLLLTTELSPFIFGLEVLSKLFNKFSVRKQRAGEAAAGSRERCTVRHGNCEQYLRHVPTWTLQIHTWNPAFLSYSYTEKVFYHRNHNLFISSSVKHHIQVCCKEVNLDSWTLSYQLKGFLSTTF